MQTTQPRPAKVPIRSRTEVASVALATVELATMLFVILNPNTRVPEILLLVSFVTFWLVFAISLAQGHQSRLVRSTAIFVVGSAMAYIVWVIISGTSRM